MPIYRLGGNSSSVSRPEKTNSRSIDSVSQTEANRYVAVPKQEPLTRPPSGFGSNHSANAGKYRLSYRAGQDDAPSLFDRPPPGRNISQAVDSYCRPSSAARPAGAGSSGYLLPPSEYMQPERTRFRYAVAEYGQQGITSKAGGKPVKPVSIVPVPRLLLKLYPSLTQE